MLLKIDGYIEWLVFQKKNFIAQLNTYIHLVPVSADKDEEV